MYCFFFKLEPCLAVSVTPIYSLYGYSDFAKAIAFKLSCQSCNYRHQWDLKLGFKPVGQTIVTERHSGNL